MSSLTVFSRRCVQSSLLRSRTARQIRYSKVNSPVVSCLLPRRNYCAVPEPQEQPKEVSPQVRKIVDDITSLNLRDVAELVETLKKELNLPDTPVGGGFAMPMPMQGMPAAGGAAAEEGGADEAEDEAKPIVSIQLDGFDDKSKIKVIKEIKAVSGLGLKEAKALVEGAPKVVVEEMKREEAEKIVETLEAAGAKVSLI
mmetsp:Transcript_15085/g.17076  ORF Transcript_15085/g.17076 Transcript_15085/m.17076 type:complete len:199 (-) Transcript_15085:256-852(-)|eukprot:CAMPEP_0184020136 /NCGR_PEP_ID=MMETSP0954-20121128/9175_1 /TAXON_ID=627963 /ORGANISM="Aplanochytrium sp, Strain PBS07" /LENGTH=198 /DNA_ID=CAMNT_0026301951 /DNA_START=282 /DNA_END=878 /DNA_ORIENTATION=+